MTFGASLSIAIASGLTGGATALAGQYLAQRAARKQHSEQLQQRSIELFASFALPVATHRAEGLEELFDLLQQVLDNRTLSLDHYDRMRRLLIYVPTHITDDLIQSLAVIAKGQRSDQAALDAAVDTVKNVQQKLRIAAGLESIDNYVDKLNDLRAEREVL
jgi:hypothetical protein